MARGAGGRWSTISPLSTRGFLSIREPPHSGTNNPATKVQFRPSQQSKWGQATQRATQVATTSNAVGPRCPPSHRLAPNRPVEHPSQHRQSNPGVHSESWLTTRQHAAETDAPQPRFASVTRSAQQQRRQRNGHKKSGRTKMRRTHAQFAGPQCRQNRAYAAHDQSARQPNPQIG